MGLGFSLLGVFSFQAWGLMGLRLLLVASVWSSQFCCAARGVVPGGGRQITSMLCL